MLTEQSIIDFIGNYEYDIRISHNGRWIDQKCTPDVLSFIADCIYFYATENPDKEFCRRIFGLVTMRYRIPNLFSRSQVQNKMLQKMNMTSFSNSQ